MTATLNNPEYPKAEFQRVMEKELGQHNPKSVPSGFVYPEEGTLHALAHL
jgi:hypothetical protein